RMLGCSIPSAYAGQAAVALFAAGAVAWIWYGDNPFRLKAAALAAASLLVSPYVLDYDMVLLALPIAWLAMEGIEHGFLDFEKSCLAAAWMLPFMARLITASTMIPVGPMVSIGVLVLV